MAGPCLVFPRGGAGRGVQPCILRVGSHIRWEGVRLGKKCSPSTNKPILVVGFAFMLSIVFFVMMVNIIEHFANCLVGFEHVRGRVWGNCFTIRPNGQFQPFVGGDGGLYCPHDQIQIHCRIRQIQFDMLHQKRSLHCKNKKVSQLHKALFSSLHSEEKKIYWLFSTNNFVASFKDNPY